MPYKQHLVVFAKTPKPGFAKTRLIPALGAEGAAALAQRLFEHTIEMAQPLGSNANTRLELCVTGAEDDAFFLPWLTQKNCATQWQLSHQQGPDLGIRMQHALTLALQHARYAIVIGTDAPSLNAALIGEAFAALQNHDAVFVPAFDGGYTLVGLRAPIPELFQDMPWGSASVMQTSRQRLIASAKTWHELAPMHDIDEPTDLIHVPSNWLP